MSNKDNEDIKVIKFGNNNNDDQKKNMKNEVNTENPNENKNPPPHKRNSKLKSQRTKAPKVYLQNLKKQKKAFPLIFHCDYVVTPMMTNGPVF